jgi:RNA polymerase sigma factor (sigma-70 family)
MDHDTLKTNFLAAYDEHADALYRFCVLKVSNKEKAEDLVQDVFTRYWQTLRLGTQVENPRAFLYTSARNRVIDLYRKRKEDSLDELTDRGFDLLGDGAASVEQEAKVREVLAAIATLDERSRDALILRHVEGWTPEEIAVHLNSNANAVSVRLNRAAQRVREVLKTDL